MGRSAHHSFHHSFVSHPGAVKLGILGGGQLCRMLLPSCRRYGIETHLLDRPDAPAARAGDHFHPGELTCEEEVVEFGRQVDVVTIEIEKVNTKALWRLQEEFGKTIAPSPAVIELIQDKGRQKDFLKRGGFPTAPYQHVENASKLKALLTRNPSSLNPSPSNRFPKMQKACRGGHDGRGVFKIKNPADVQRALDGPSILEDFVPIHQEISLIVARNEQGQVQSYPPVEMVFNPELNLLDHLFCPANISPSISRECSELAITIANALEVVGVLAVELFITKDSQVLVNELAPRPHNSGHHTIEANYTCQFEQHLRGILNWPLGDSSAHHCAVMLNLLGEKSARESESGSGGESGIGVPDIQGLDKVLSFPQVYVHLYGKTTTFPGRKMGHLTILGSNLKQAKTILKEVRKWPKITPKAALLPK